MRQRPGDPGDTRVESVPVGSGGNGAGPRPCVSHSVDPLRSAVVFGTVGDLVEDVVVHLAGPINVAADTDAVVIRRRGGSAANAAVAAARAGAAARFIGQVGDDSTGAALIETLKAERVEVVARRRGRSGAIVVLVDETGERTMLSDRATCPGLDDPDPAWLDGLTVLHVPTYSLTEGTLAATSEQLVRWCHERGIKVSIDASSTSVMTRYGIDRLVALYLRLRPDVLLCNQDEGACLGGRLDPTDEGVGVGAGLVIVKHGRDPAVVMEPGRPPYEVPVPPLEHVGDTTGAGDSFAAGFLIEWTAGVPVGDAVAAGHRTAAATIGRVSCNNPSDTLPPDI